MPMMALAFLRKDKVGEEEAECDGVVPRKEEANGEVPHKEDANTKEAERDKVALHE